MKTSDKIHPKVLRGYVFSVSLTKLTAIVLVLEIILFMTAFRVLAKAVNWPASLDKPAAVVLPLFTQHRGAAIAGYYSYMLSALLLIPISLMLHRVLARENSLLLMSATWFGVLSGAMKSLGIVRWLFLMPFLADTYMNPKASATTRETVALVYDAFNLYAGKVGEHLGGHLLTAFWVGLMAIVLMRSRLVPGWIAWTGIVVAVGWLVGLIGDFGVNIGPVVSINTSLLNFWYFALAVALFRTRTR